MRASAHIRATIGRIMSQAPMVPPYGLKIVESCLTCPLRQDYVFCDLPPDALRKLASITSVATYPKGAILFLEEQPSRGVFVVCTGRVKLSASSAEGKTLILRIAEPGELVGLPATLSGEPYGVTAEILEPTQANFIPREAFLSFLREHGEAALKVAQLLSGIVHSGYREIRSLALSRSSEEKVAKFLLDWSDRHGKGERQAQLKLTLTHEEIAQMIGASRETVTRTLADLKKKQLVEIKGSTLVIRNRAALENLAGGQT